MLEQLESDLKQAMLAGDKSKVSTLRVIKSAFQYAQVAKAGNEPLDEAELQAVLQREAKKRTEAAELYQKNGSPERANAELAEKKIIEAYLPKQLSQEELVVIVDSAINELGATDMQMMGKVIGHVKSQVGATADGAAVASLVKDRLQGN